MGGNSSGGKSGVEGLLRLLRRKAKGGSARVRYAHRKAVEAGEWTEPIRTMTFTALDCQTTGPNPARDEILSIGAVRIRDNRIVLGERFYQAFKPSEAVSPKEIILVHGLGRDEVARSMPLAEALDQLIAFIGDSVVVGYHTEIDLRFLNVALAARAGSVIENPAIDTRLLYRWSRRATSPSGQASGDARLEDIVTEMGLPRYPAQHAFYDALSTGLVFLKLLGDFEASGAVQFRALYREGGVY